MKEEHLFLFMPLFILFLLVGVLNIFALIFSFFFYGWTMHPMCNWKPETRFSTAIYYVTKPGSELGCWLTEKKE